MIPGNKLLPPARILEKLAAVDVDAPRRIFEIFPEVSRARRVEEESSLKVIFRKESRKAFWKGFFEGFGALLFVAPPVGQIAMTENESRQSAAESINTAWAHTGNDLRQAIKQYCAENPAIAALANLSVQDMQDLEPLIINKPQETNAAAYAGYTAPSCT